MAQDQPVRADILFRKLPSSGTWLHLRDENCRWEISVNAWRPPESYLGTPASVNKRNGETAVLFNSLIKLKENCLSGLRRVGRD